jgi:hypothetical protein
MVLEGLDGLESAVDVIGIKLAEVRHRLRWRGNARGGGTKDV